MENMYRRIIEPINSKLMVVQNSDYKWGVIDESGNVIVPFGKYAWIDGFQNGLAKVIGHNDNTSPNIVGTFDDNWNFVEAKDMQKHYEQGIINESGEEVLSLEYNVWKFYGKDFPTIKYFKEDKVHTVSFESLNPNLGDEDDNFCDECDFDSEDYRDNDYMRDSWDAMTDGQYGDMPDGFDGDYDFLGY